MASESGSQTLVATDNVDCSNSLNSQDGTAKSEEPQPEKQVNVDSDPEFTNFSEPPAPDAEEKASESSSAALDSDKTDGVNNESNGFDPASSQSKQDESTSDAPMISSSTEISEIEGYKGKESGRENTPPEIEDSVLQVSSRLVEEALQTMGELNLIKNKFQSLKNEVKDNPQLLVAIRDLQFVTEEMQRHVSKLRLSTLKTIFENMYRVVRSAAKDTKKKVKLNISGHETLIDRKILALLKEPLVHMVRNSVDHGIESPEKRVGCRKDPQGTISIKAFYRSGEVQISISDDGAGIDVERVKTIAVNNGIISEKESKEISDNEAYHLIFEPGFSTREAVTKLSGRGVGMDIVKTAVKKIRGNIDIFSEIGVGTTIVLKLPLNLSIIESLYIQVGTERYTIPQNNVEEVFPKNSSSIAGNIIEKPGIGRLLKIRGSYVPIISINKILDTKPAEAPEYIIIKMGKQRYGLEIDKVLTPSTVFVQNLDRKMGISGPYSGVSKYVDGRPVLQLDLNKISKTINSVNTGVKKDYSLSKNVEIELTQSDIKRLHQKIISFKNGKHFGIPIQRVTNIFYVKAEDIHTIGDHHQSYVTEDSRTISLLWVEELLHISEAAKQEFYWVAEFHIRDQCYGIVMNDFLGIIPMSLNYKLLDYDEAILGSTIENNETHLILDTHALALKSQKTAINLI